MAKLRYAGEEIFFANNIILQQIEKRTAKKLFDAHKKVWICACNARVDGRFGAVLLNHSENYSDTFESAVYDYTYYNCIAELGKYPIFFRQI